MIRFSVITITYNAEKVLQRTLDSVLCQTYGGVEHLIIDGASKDDTLTLAEAYKQQSDASDNGHKVIIQSEPDQGIYDAMNKGLTQAYGDYVVYLNAGDFFPSNDTLEQIVHRCRLTELPSDSLPGVLYGNTDIVDGEGRFLHPRRLQPPAQLTWRSFRHGMLVCHQAFYARTDIAKNLQYDTRYRFSADVDWCIRIMKEAEKQGLEIKGTKNTISQFYTGGATTQHHTESLIERFKVMTDHYGLCSTVWHHLLFAVRGIAKKIS